MSSILETAQRVLDLAEKADRTPLMVNRHDTVAGAIGWQLQQEGGRGEVVGEMIDLDIPKAKGTAHYLAAVHADAPELARFALLVDELTRVILTTSRPDDYGTGWNHALAEVRRRLGLPSSSLGESGSGEVAP